MPIVHYDGDVSELVRDIILDLRVNGSKWTEILGYHTRYKGRTLFEIRRSWGGIFLTLGIGAKRKMPVGLTEDERRYLKEAIKDWHDDQKSLRSYDYRKGYRMDEIPVDI